jgi:hypothetical protein
LGLPLERDENAVIDDFQFDDDNMGHMARHGVSKALVFDVAVHSPRIFVNPPTPNRSGSHLLIGPDTSGRMWTIVIVWVDGAAALWRPITGWPSTGKERRAWQDI